ncbi:MAG: hypothetical protein IPP17_16110 [Bacteroidetes bacterium]|nr:hypothetical protein [Bacteroidota bacterium]
MEKFAVYFLSVNLLLLFQALYFRLFLAKQRRFGWNRIYLLGGIAVALLLPAIRWEILPASLPETAFIRTIPESVVGPAVEVSPTVVEIPAIGTPIHETSSIPTTSGTIAPVVNATWSALDIAIAVYGLGVFIALLAFIWRNLKVIRLIWKGQKTRHAGFTLVETEAEIGPASYFRYIFWKNNGSLDAQSQAVALAHEQCHSRQLHSLDLMAIELIKVFCWFNPAIYLLRKDLRKTHEFLADQAALEVAGPDGIKRLLLMRQFGATHLVFANYFHSHLKARIMILTEKSPRKPILQYLLVLPLAALMAACTSLAHPVENQATSLESQPTAGNDSMRTANTEANAPMPEIFSVENMLLEAQLPGASNTKKGIVCLGRQPQVLNLDTTLTVEELQNVDNHPYLLNRAKVRQQMGNPKDDKAELIKGKIVVKLLVDETGHVIRHQYTQPGDQRLRDAVEAHVHDLLFKPGKENGVPTEWWVILPIEFGMPGC